MYRPDTLPDVTSEARSTRLLPLQWVGMEQIDVPIRITDGAQGSQRVNAKANLFVSLDEKSAKGIHMSRLHSILNRLERENCTKDTIDQLLHDCVDSQGGISESARLELSFDLLLEKPALLSGEIGYQAYPVVITGSVKNGERVHEIEVTIPYSSTCPCSASLARQLLANAVDERFPAEKIDKASLLRWMQSEHGSIATPHAQRSYAYLRLVLDDNPWPDLADLVRDFEAVIGTPVQTAVKRVDEQEFARLNAENLMFCEDTARRVKQRLEEMPGVADYWLKVEHQESLHAHNAVVIDRKQHDAQNAPSSRNAS